MAQVDGVSPHLIRFFAGLTQEQRDLVVDALRDPRTYLAEDLTDVIAILRQLDS